MTPTRGWTEYLALALPNLVAVAALVLSVLAYRETAEQSRVARQQLLPYFVLEEVKTAAPETMNLVVHNNGAPVRAMRGEAFAFLEVSCFTPTAHTSKLIPIGRYYQSSTRGTDPAEALRATGTPQNLRWYRDLETGLDALAKVGDLATRSDMRAMVSLYYQDALGYSRSEHFTNRGGHGFSRLSDIERDVIYNRLFSLPSPDEAVALRGSLTDITPGFVRATCL